MSIRLLLFCLFLFFSLCLSHALPSVPQKISNGIFRGRSGDIIIAPKNIPQDNYFFILKYPADAYKNSEIDETEFADLISHLVGTTPVNLDASRSYFPEIDFFERPKANLFIAFDSLDEEGIVQAPELNFMSHGQKVRIVNSTYPPNSVVKLTTLLTGTTPSTHGIVSESWLSDGLNVKAYSSHGLPSTANFPDILSQSFSGRSLTLALSANYQLSAASSVHRTTLTRQPFWNNFALYWNTIEEFVDSPSISRLQDQFMITRSQLLRSFSEATTFSFLENSGINARYLKNSNTIQFTLKDRSHVEFDLNKKENLFFFIEVELVRVLLTQLKTNSFIRGMALDQAPDHFSIVFSSLRSLREKNGKDSLIFQASIQILDQIVSKLMSTIESVYDNRVVTELVFLGNDNTEQLIPKIKKSLPQSVLSQISESFLPQIYSNKANETFSEIQHAFSNTDLKAYFFPQKHSSENAHWRTERYYMDLSEEILAATNNTNETYTQDQVAVFHMLLWTPIILAILVLFVVYMIVDMAESGKDSMLFRSTQTRHPHQA